MNLSRSFFLIALLSAIFFLTPELGFSDEGSTGERDGISNALCQVFKLFQGSWGKGIATIAIIAVAIGLFLGKLSWGIALATAIGIGMIFGAPALVNRLGSTTDIASNTCAGNDPKPLPPPAA